MMLNAPCKRGRYRSPAQTRLLLFAETGNSVPMPFLVVKAALVPIAAVSYAGRLCDDGFEIRSLDLGLAVDAAVAKAINYYS